MGFPDSSNTMPLVWAKKEREINNKKENLFII
jgi:hypothetical protein